MNLLRRTVLGIVAMGALLSIASFTAVADEGTLLARTPVPSAEKPQGEVRILLRGKTERVVQTVLYSKVLRRVAGKIAEKESRNWPEGGPGHDESTRFVAALRELAADVNRLPRDGEASGDRRRGMLIEFSTSRSGTRIRLTAARVVESEGELRILERHEPTVHLEADEDYVRDNQRFIVMDAFAVSADRADALIAGSAD